MRTGRLAIELEAELLELADDLPLPDSGESAYQVPTIKG